MSPRTETIGFEVAQYFLKFQWGFDSMATPARQVRGQHSPTYRFDLDGLRGYAIALVVLFHVYVGRVSGGVDVFLLLSGFFFLGSQLRYALRPSATLNPWWPIWRTLRRLLPALAVVIALTCVAVYFLTPELITPELTSQLTASVLYYLNWELMVQDAAYAAASVDTSPLQHLWSMSVQGQFYLFAIFFALAAALWARGRGANPETIRRVCALILVAITVVSFLWASRFGLIGTPANYYSTFSRAWEMALGALLALVVHRVTVPAKVAPITAGAGVVMITATGILIPTSLAFPGPLTLLPLTGAVLVIISGGDHVVSRALSSRPARWLGEIAYSLYLWHWPLLIIATVYFGYTTPPAWLGTLVIAASLLLAHLTHRFVESPLRQHRKRPTRRDAPMPEAMTALSKPSGKRRAAGGVLVAAVLAAIMAVQPVWNAYAERQAEPLDPALYPGVMAQFGAEVPPVNPRPDPLIIAGIYLPIGADGCMVSRVAPADEFRGPECTYGDLEAETTVALIGGSHAEPWGIPLDILGREHGFRVVPLIRQECPVVLGDTSTVTPECAEWGALAFGRLLEMNPDLVVSTSTRPTGPIGEGPDDVPAGYVGLWDALSQNGIPFLGLRDNPWFFDEEGMPQEPNDCMVRNNDNEACSMPRDEVYAPSDPAEPILAQIPQAYGIDTVDWFCTADICPPVIGNVYAYRDQNHVSNAFAASTSPLLWEHIEPILSGRDF